MYIVTVRSTYSSEIGTYTVVAPNCEFTYNIPVEYKNTLLAFSVKAAESTQIYGNESKRIYTKDLDSTWEYRSQMPYPKSIFSLATIEEKIYVFGGWQNGTENRFKGIEEYDTLTDTWTVMDKYPREDVPYVERATMESVNGKLYILGGSFGTVNYLPYVYEYDPKLNTWTRKADMPIASDQMRTAVHDGKIYV